MLYYCPTCHENSWFNAKRWLNMVNQDEITPFCVNCGASELILDYHDAEMSSHVASNPADKHSVLSERTVHLS